MEPVADRGKSTSVRGRSSSAAQRPNVEAVVTSGATRLALDERQLEVLKLLKDEGCGFTMRQIQARLSWPAGETAPVVQELLRLGLVKRLNTVVPSFALRVEAVEASDL